MKYIFILLLSLSSLCFGSNPEFPNSPDPKLTPGSLCTKPDEYRYPERIPYCDRDVDSSEKDVVFTIYRKELGYVLSPRQRRNYKIDHYFPLCAGGSNELNNLWPQHRSIYEVTDPIESIGCAKLKLGRISQKDLLKMIVDAKRDLSQAREVLRKLESL